MFLASPYSLRTVIFRSSLRRISPQNNNFTSVALSAQTRRITLRNTWKVHPDLDIHVRESLSEQKDNTEKFSRDTGFSVTFLGTSAGKANPERGNSATAIRTGSTTYLFDAGEGVQLQMMLSKLRVGDIQRIFISHLHGDHIFGLPGLLLSMQEARQGKKTILEVYGPVGLYNFITVSLSLSMTELRKTGVIVYELQSSAKRWTHPGSVRQYREFGHRGIRRKSIPQNPDGTWTLCSANEVDTPEKAVRLSSQPTGMHVTAAEINHIPKVQCFGFAVEEPRTLPRNIDINKVKECGVKPGKKLKLLKSGFSVPADDDADREVTADDIATGPRPKARKVVILGDCFHVPEPMASLCKSSDVLVHEATFCGSDQGVKVEYGGHSTASMAGKFARFCEPSVLALNHISVAITHDEKKTQDLIKEAEIEVEGCDTKVQLSYDFLELLIPRGGFQFDSQGEDYSSDEPESV